MRTHVATYIFIMLLGLSCVSRLPTEADLLIDFENIDFPTVQLADSLNKVMNGVYAVVKGKESLGETVVGKWIKNRWCLLAQHDAVYAVNAGGKIEDSIRLSGYIRIIRSGNGKKIKTMVRETEGASEILAGKSPSQILIRGNTESGEVIELKRLRAIESSSFQIIGHRGGGRNSDRLGISENSLQMISYSQFLGATGIEIDVRRTRDRKIIVFHDDTFSPRTVQGTYLLGNVEDFDLDHIRTFGRLVNGEQIPTLSEVLEYVIDHTALSLVWMDLKNSDIMDEVIKIQKDASDYAASKSRTLSILLGIPSTEVLANYNKSIYKGTTDILIEFDAATALSIPNCKVWAPRWTTNITQADVDNMHSAGKLVFTWTVDLREAIIDYHRKVDGILTNYPSLVAGIQGSL